MALVIAIVIALVLAYFFRQALIDSMSNVHVAQEAHDYLQNDSVNITTEIDMYLFTSLSVVPKPQDDDDQNVDDNVNDDSDDDSDNDSDDSDNDSDDDSDNDSDDGGSDGGDGGD